MTTKPKQTRVLRFLFHVPNKHKRQTFCFTRARNDNCDGFYRIVVRVVSKRMRERQNVVIHENIHTVGLKKYENTVKTL
jgi:hypothetical protein